MQKAHQHGIIHRDIKPANILIAGDHQAKVVDFSLAKLTGETGLTRTGSTIGTAAFMSPEQVEGRPVNHQSDIWSLAVTLYCMISGELPFSGEVDQSVMYAIVHHEPKAVKLAAGEVPKGLDRVLDRALQRDLSKRYQSVSEMRQDLLALKTEILSGEVQTSHPRLRGLKRGWRKRLPKLAAAVCILLVAGTYVMSGNIDGTGLSR